MKFEKTFTLGNIISLGALMVAFVFGYCGYRQTQDQIDLQRAQIESLEQREAPDFFTSITWSDSTSPPEGKDWGPGLWLPRIDIVAEEADTCPASTGLAWYVWLVIENVGESETLLIQVKVSYNWREEDQEQELVRQPRYLRPDQRLFFHLFCFSLSEAAGAGSSYLNDNLKVKDIWVTYEYPDGHEQTKYIKYTPIVGPPALLLVPYEPPEIY